MTHEEKERLEKNLRLLQSHGVRITAAFKTILLSGQLSNIAPDRENLILWTNLDLLLMVHPLVEKIDDYAVSRVIATKGNVLYSTHSKAWID